MRPVIASIPSPSSGFFELGPLDVHMYGLMLLLAIAVCIVVTGLRWTKRPGAEGGDWDLLLRIAVWGVAAGIVGARAYHVITSWSEVPDPKWQGVFMVWRGGLGVWGGIFLGTVVGGYICKRAGKNPWALMDAAAPGLLLAHGIGRFGNWWNQELFGKPTNLPWGLEIDPQNRPFQYAGSDTFHPTFLYEFVYVTAAAVLLLVLDRFIRFRPPALFALYVSLYTFGRFFEEMLRIDPSHELGPWRLNAWVSLVVFILSTAFFIYWQFLRGRGPRRRERTREAPKDAPKMAIPKGRVRHSR
jgi:phosphatidylglycerol---prolipoprotein diacylglyceryl transferase